MNQSLLRRAVLAAVAGFCAIAGPDPVQACSCGPAQSPCESALSARLVFTAEVIAITPYGPESVVGGRKFSAELRVRLKVSERFRGDLDDEIEVFTARTGAACGFSFDKGKSYLVYGYWDTVALRWKTNSCSRTRPLSAAKEDLKYLRNSSGTPGAQSEPSEMKCRQS